MNKIEHRIKLFQELSNNKWYHIMNHNLDVIKHIIITTEGKITIYNKKELFMLIKYGSEFYF